MRPSKSFSFPIIWMKAVFLSSIAIIFLIIISCDKKQQQKAIIIQNQNIIPEKNIAKKLDSSEREDNAVMDSLNSDYFHSLHEIDFRNNLPTEDTQPLIYKYSKTYQNKVDEIWSIAKQKFSNFELQKTFAENQIGDFLNSSKQGEIREESQKTIAHMLDYYIHPLKWHTQYLRKPSDTVGGYGTIGYAWKYDINNEMFSIDGNKFKMRSLDYEKLFALAKKMYFDGVGLSNAHDIDLRKTYDTFNEESFRKMITLYVKNIDGANKYVLVRSDNYEILVEFGNDNKIQLFL